MHCEKCDGYGVLSEYSHIDNGVCFECGGVKTNFDKRKKEDKKASMMKYKELQDNKRKLFVLKEEMSKRERIKEMIIDIGCWSDEDLKYLKSQDKEIKTLSEKIKELESTI